MSCFDGVSVTGSIADFEGPVLIEVCFEGVCGKVDGFAANNYIGYEVVTELSHTTFSFGEKGASGRSVSADVALKTAPHRGDEYELKVTDAHTGKVLGAVSGQPDYASFCPNGCECGPECKRAELEMKPP